MKRHSRTDSPSQLSPQLENNSNLSWFRRLEQGTAASSLNNPEHAAKKQRVDLHKDASLLWLVSFYHTAQAAVDNLGSCFDREKVRAAAEYCNMDLEPQRIFWRETLFRGRHNVRLTCASGIGLFSQFFECFSFGTASVQLICYPTALVQVTPEEEAKARKMTRYEVADFGNMSKSDRVCFVLRDLSNLESSAARAAAAMRQKKSAKSRQAGPDSPDSGRYPLFEAHHLAQEVALILCNCVDLMGDFVALKMVEVLISLSRESEALRAKTSEAIATLCDIAPHHAPTVRTRITEAEVLPDVALMITSMYCHDEVMYLSGIFNMRAGWLLNEKVTLHNVLVAVEANIMRSLRNDIASTHRVSEAELCSKMRVLCGLAGLFQFQFPDHDLETCLEVAKGARGDRLSKLSLCFLLISGEQFNRLSEPKLVQALSDLLQSEHSEMSLMLGVYFISNQLPEIEKIVRAALSIQISMPRNALYQLRKIFTANLFDYSVLARRALKLRPTGVSTEEHQASVDPLSSYLRPPPPAPSLVPILRQRPSSNRFRLQ
ncbi:hypothetical protein BDK51DRAFT_50475 [Blyttiomyces helicus]|uniref:Uncharacterized protein n=1 Tax=Blyttiomyces helicus TaxID=388810 RepID=A0A4P9W2Z3_9FUNG|nr:hypothetical protein BDK51DRAFT_50475 [Blyttiomyces helicus]|eukprot:RKO86649.1 hypothetical protein BDK51DRAFT_50475 [Blyttiomyces helicus]